VLQCVAVCCSVVYGVAVWCSELRYPLQLDDAYRGEVFSDVQCVAVCSCVAMSFRVL